MCGLAGYLRLASPAHPDAVATARAMADEVRHRGPDDAGAWADPDVEVALGHRRLAVIDLSEHGHQPMVSHDGRYAIAFNGEIYGFERMRQELEHGETIAWRGHSDTEVLLEAIARRGLAWALEEAVGMFAFAVWDRRDRVLTLARDRMGEKPLYYGQFGGHFRGHFGEVVLFGSQLSALRAHPQFSGEIDRDALALYLRHGYVPAPWSIYRSVRKLPPGTSVRIHHGRPTDAVESPQRYWDLRPLVEHPRPASSWAREDDVVDELESLLREALSLQRVADVPVGAFLSGGIDSAVVVSLLQEISDRPVRTFTIGFDDPAFDESAHAAEVARRLGTEHVELRVDPRQAMDLVAELPEHYDEPFADSSQLPTLLVCRLARERVTVALSGDGGDELFGGYNRYALAQRLWSGLKWVPPVLRHTAARAARAVPTVAWGGLRPLLARLPLDDRTRRFPADRVQAVAEVLEGGGGRELYDRLCSHWKNGAEVVRGAHPVSTAYGDRSRWPATDDLLSHMSYVDAVTYLPDDILVKVDRAAMSVALETRIPLLDHRVVEFAARLPSSFKVRDGVRKWPLRQLLYRRLPASMFDRPKSGFAVPLAAWLRGPFRAWGEALLAPARLRAEGYFDPVPIERMWTEHQRGDRNWHAYLWDVLMFQSWLERYPS